MTNSGTINKKNIQIIFIHENVGYLLNKLIRKIVCFVDSSKSHQKAIF